MKLRTNLKSTDSELKLTAETKKSATRSEKHNLKKVPYMVLVGDKDIENNTVSIRNRVDGDIGSMSMDEFMAIINKENEEKTIK